MNLPEISIKRPVSVLMMTLVVMLFGVVAVTRLPVELYPNTSLGEISIVIYVRGQMPPSEVENQVTRLVEDAVSTVSNMKQMLSVTKEGESTVILSFEPGTNMNFAALEVREKFSKIKNKLPKEIEKPIIAQFKQSDLPVLIVAVTSQLRTTEDIRTLVDEKIKERLKRITGVANVEVAGGRERKILVEVDQQKLVAYGISMQEVTGSLQVNNLNLLSGEIERVDNKLLIRLIGEFDSIEQIKNMGIKMVGYGSIIRLDDIATVKDSYLDPEEYARLNVKPICSIYIQKQSTDNTIRVVGGLLEEIENIKKELPQDLRLVPTSNQAVFINEAIEGLKVSLLQGIILIILVFFLFLFKLNRRQTLLVLGLIIATVVFKNAVLYVILLGLLYVSLRKPDLRSVVIVTLSIPISVVATFVYMYLSKLTLNVITLFGLALGVGMLVDNSIVVFDNILKKREKGIPIVESSIEGTREVMIPIVASTLTVIVVFLPMIFLSKDIQILYSGMALTLVSSLVVSLIAALTIVPLLASQKFFSQKVMLSLDEAKDFWVNRIFPWEKKILFKAIRHTRYIILGSVLSVVLSFFFMSKLGMEYLGSAEEDKFTIFVEMPTGVKLDVSDEAVRRVEKALEEIPEIKTFTSRVEAWSSKVYVELLPQTQRKRSTHDVIEAIRQETDKMQPAFVYFQEDQSVGTKELIVEVFGYDYKLLRQLAIGIANRLDSVPGLTDLKIRMREGRPEMDILVEKHKAATFDLSTQEVADQVHAKMRGLRATLYHEKGQEIETITRIDERYRKTFRDLYKMVMDTPREDPVFLEQVANFKFDLGPSEVWRKNKSRMIQVSANVGKVPLSKIVSSTHERLKDLEFPEDYYYRIGGDYPTLVKSSREMRQVIIMVIFLVYMVLAALFESLYEPLLIMIAVPLALGGAVIGLYLGPKTIGMGALLGMMILGGVVVNHNIILVDRINYYRRERKFSLVRSAILANKDRLRPILLTTFSTILGLIPMAVDKSQGANLWSPLAITMIGGMVSSLFLSLLVTPSFYLVLNRFTEDPRKAVQDLVDRIKALKLKFARQSA